MNNNLDHLALSLCPSLDWDRDKHNWVEGFKAGVAAAGNNPDILQAILQPFAEWINERYCNDGDLKLWRELGTLNYYSDEELIAKYIQFITDKQKEDGNAS